MARARGLSAVPEPQEPKRRRRAPAKKTAPPKARAKRSSGLSSELEDERETLVMLRSALKAKIADAPTHALAPIVKQFRDVDREIRAIDAKAKAQAEEDGVGGDADAEWNDDEL